MTYKTGILRYLLYSRIVDLFCSFAYVSYQALYLELKVHIHLIAPRSGYTTISTTCGLLVLTLFRSDDILQACTYIDNIILAIVAA